MRSLNLVRVCEHTFHLESPADIQVVVDLGMNHGDFSTWITQHTGALCYGAEPVPELFESLPRSERIAARQVAIGGHAGIRKLSIPANSCASLSETGIVGEAKSIDVEIVTFSSFIKSYGIHYIDLLKIDIEGAEIDMLGSMDDGLFEKIGQMTIEFHDFMKPSDRPLVKDLIKKIEDRGFFVINFGWKNFTDVMCINMKRFEVDLTTKCGMYFLKYYKGVARILRRQFLHKAEHHSAV